MCKKYSRTWICRKICGSSIIEVIVAMIISSIILLFSFTVIMNVFRYNRGLSDTHYHFLGESIMYSLIKGTNKMSSEVESLEGVSVKYIMGPYRDIYGLNYVEVVLYDADSVSKSVSRCLFLDE